MDASKQAASMKSTKGLSDAELGILQALAQQSMTDAAIESHWPGGVALVRAMARSRRDLVARAAQNTWDILPAGRQLVAPTRQESIVALAQEARSATPVRVVPLGRLFTESARAGAMDAFAIPSGARH